MLISHFEITKSAQIGDKLNLFFEEKNTIPEEFNSQQLISKGFHKEIII